MIRYQSGSLEAFQEIYAQLAPGVRRYLLHWHAAQKSPMICFKKLFFKCPGQEPHTTRNMRLDHGCLARNVFLMNRRAARQWAKAHESREDLPDFPVFPEADRLGSQDEIRICVADLAPDQAEALLLHHEWGFSFEEIAGMLGISARASRGMADLRWR
jgi:RNA polymerase sigma-70 factor, ECF subfamily